MSPVEINLDEEQHPDRYASLLEAATAFVAAVAGGRVIQDATIREWAREIERTLSIEPPEDTGFRHRRRWG